jgi:hypothetical protein
MKITLILALLSAATFTLAGCHTDEVPTTTTTTTEESMTRTPAPAPVTTTETHTVHEY